MRTLEDTLFTHWGTRDHSEASELFWKQFRSNPPADDQFSKLRLPYKSPGGPDLPTVADIKQVLLADKRTRRGEHDVCRMGDMIVKRTPQRALIHEAENMLWLRANTKVRVPRVYGVWTEDDQAREGRHVQMYYLAMEHIHGYHMSWNLYHGLSQREQDMFCQALAEQLQLLRSVSQSGDLYYGRVDHQSFDPQVTLVRRDLTKLAGPFHSYDEYMEETLACHEYDVVTFHPSDFPVAQTESWPRYKAVVGTASATRPKLTHLDLSTHNVVANAIHDSGGRIAKFEVTIIDWDGMAWLPEWVQCVVLHRCFILYRRRVGLDFFGFMEADALHNLERNNSVFSRIEDISRYQAQLDFFRENAGPDFRFY